MSEIRAINKLLESPDETAICLGDDRRSWHQLFAGALSILDLLHAHEVKPGEHVAVLMANCPEYYEVLLGSVLAGVWLTPVNSHLTAHETGYVLDDSGARVLFTDRNDGLPDSRCLTLSKPFVRSGVDAKPEASTSLHARVQGLLSSQAGGFLMYTSGTTGRPKGVKRGAPGRVDETLTGWAALGRSIGLDGRGSHLVTGPVYHAAPGLYSLYDLLNGATLVLMSRWDTRDCLSLIEACGITHTHLVPTMFVRLLRERPQLPRDYDLSSLALVLHGAAPTAVQVKRDMIAWWGEVLVEYWGGSESGIITRVDSAEWLAHPGTVGRPLPQFELSVRGEDFSRLPLETVGALYARRAGVARPFYYYNDEDKTAGCYVDDWFTLGDLGWLDEEGYVYIADRRSNLIISGGVNIYPAEIEAALLEHPAVADVAVVGLDDEEWGKRVHAFLQPVNMPEQTDAWLEEISAFASERLAAFKVPRSMELIEQLPRYDSGKLYLSRLIPV